MNPIYKHRSIEGRPVFSHQQEEGKRTEESMMGKNQLLKQLKPVKSHSRMIALLRKVWKSISQFFVIQYPSPIKENKGGLIRPSVLDVGLTVGNLWHHYKPFITMDKECPQGLKKIFEKMEKEEREILKLNRMEPPEKTNQKTKALIEKIAQKKKAFIEKKIQEIQKMEVGSTRLFVLDRQESLDQSVSGNLFCTITRTDKGYTLHWIGSEAGEVVKLGGKEKVQRSLTFTDIPSEVFAPFVNDFVKGWVEEGVSGLNFQNFKDYQKKDLGLEDFTTKASRVDKLFWNILLAIPQEKKETTREAIRGMRLRTELLTLYEAFDKERGDLKPQTEKYRDLKRLHQEVSKKVLLYYRKGYLSEADFNRIKGELVLIDDVLVAAKHPDSKSFAAKASFKSPEISGMSLDEAQIKQMNPFSEYQEPVRGKSRASNDPISLSVDRPVSLVSYNTIDSPKTFMDTILEFHQTCKQVNPQEKKALQEKMARFFYEIPRPDDKESFWKKLDKLEARQAMAMLVDLTEFVIQEKQVRNFTQYDMESLLMMENSMCFLNAYTTDVVFHGGITREYDHLRHLKREDTSALKGDWAFQRKFNWHFREGSEKFFDMVGKERKYITLPKESYDLLSQQREILNHFFQNSDNNYDHGLFDFFKKLVSSDKWIRPIQNPYLIALHQEASLRAQSSKETTSGEVITPEAFFDNPEAVFEDYLKKLKNPQGSDLSLPFTPSEMKSLSRLLRNDVVHPEMVAFMKESSHLMLNPEVRNFFDALFFGRRLDNSFFSNRMKSSAIWEQIEEEIGKLSHQIQEQIEKKDQDEDLLKSRFEMLLYYKEVFIRLNGYIALKGERLRALPPNWEEELKKNCEMCRTHPALSSSFGYASRVYLRNLLSSKEVSNEKFPEILKLYADIHGTSIDPMNVEPQFEQAMERHWSLITSQMEKQGIQAKDWESLLNRFVAKRGLLLEGSAWTHEGGLRFNNGIYAVDLKEWRVTPVNSSVLIGTLPPSLASHPKVKPLLKDNPQVMIEQKGETTLYSFKDHKGVLTQIEAHDQEMFIYKKVNLEGKETWMQSLDLKKTERKKPKGLIEAWKTYKKLQKEKTSTQFFARDFYVDPNHPDRKFVISETGQVEFEVKLEPSANEIKVSSLYDLRGKRSGPWTISPLQDLKGPLEALTRIENKEEIRLWSRKGKLKKVELPRYGLEFQLNEGRLECTREPFKGYTVKLDALDHEKKGIAHALLLEPPNERMPKKLLVPTVESFTIDKKILMPKGRGLGKLRLIIKMIRSLMKGKWIKTVIKPILALNKKPSYVTFDLVPFTEQICKTGPSWPFDLLQLIQHALFSSQTSLAEDYLKQLPLKSACRDTKLLKQLIYFVASPGEGSVIKLRLAIQLLKVLEENQRLKDPLRAALEAAIIRQGHRVLQEGRRNSSKLTKQERAKLAQVMKARDPEFFKNHFVHHFLKTGQVISQDEKTKIQVEERIKKHLPIPVPIEKRIAALEKKLKPQEPLQKLEVSCNFTEKDDPILFTQDQVSSLFTSQKTSLPKLSLERQDKEQPFEKVALDAFQKDLDQYQTTENLRDHYTLKTKKALLKKFVNDQLLPEQAKQEALMAKSRQIIEDVSRRTDQAEKQMGILSGEIRPKTIDQLTLDLVKGEAMDPIIKQELIRYYDALSKLNAAISAISLVHTMKKEKIKHGKDWDLMSDELYRFLTLKRGYDPEADPRLLVFEALTFKNFKDLPGGLNQLTLLGALLSHASNLVQAPTGAGKTSILSVLESLLKANGENLIIQKVLPPLFNQTESQAQAVLGELFGALVMPLRVNMKMPMTKNEIVYEIADGKREEKTVKISIFKGMYEDLLEVMQNRGLVLTDYTSLPILEAKYFKLGGELLSCAQAGVDPTDLQKEHYTYLRKILILLKNKGLESMDEFDQPNRPIQKIQLDLVLGSKAVPEFVFDTSLKIYDILLNDPELGLGKNIQGDLKQETRMRAIHRAAALMAKDLAGGNENVEKGLFAYFKGDNEEILDTLSTSHSLDFLDKVALCKDQFTIYLPLSLGGNAGSRYDRSDDGIKTVPCQNGEKHDAKFGTILEQINYLIQDYLQNGVTDYDIQVWFKEFKQEWDQTENRTTLEKEFKGYFPDLDVLQVAENVKAKKTETLVDLVNQDPKKVRNFLLRRLQALKSSGAVISLDPLNAVDISRAVSGISATTGAPESLHAQFKMDIGQVGQIKAGMAYRIQGRALEQNVLPYDPEKPEELLQKMSQPASAIIDGAGAFRNSSKEAAENVLKTNSELKQVGYHAEDKSIVFVGENTGILNETGFFYKQSNTRGTDMPLSSQAHALLTLNDKDGIRDFAQKEGRLRREGQTYQVAMPKDQAATTVMEEMRNAVCVDAGIDAKDTYRHYRQVFPAMVRNAMKEKLLACEEIDQFLALFQHEAVRDLFISRPENSYQEPGAYFQARKHIQREDVDPYVALEALRTKYLNIAIDLELNSAIQGLGDFTYPEGIFQKMPSKVSDLQGELENELQVEQEEEQEAEVEEQLELQQNVEAEEEQSKGKSDLFYPPRMQSKEKALASQIHHAYDPLLSVSEAFLPFKRNMTKTPFKRQPFEHSMFNIGEVLFRLEKGKIVSATIEDPLRDSEMLKEIGFIYDIRTGKVSLKNYGLPEQLTVFNTFGSEEVPILQWSKEEVSLSDVLQSSEFQRLIAQSKFLDGRSDGYNTQGELGELKKWLEESNPVEMKRHFREDILRFRYRDKNRFDSTPSQLGELFNELIA